MISSLVSLVIVAQVQNMSRFESQFVGFVDRALGDPTLTLVAVGVAFGVGALHALAPGHGKAIAAAYLIGGRGRGRDALLLGVVVALMHTASVLILGLGLEILLRAGGGGNLPTAAEDVTPVLRVLSGLAVVGVGVFLLVRLVRRARHRPAPSAHEHAVAAVQPGPFSRRGLVVLGLSGGLLPSPSAFLVLATTSFTGRLGLGLVLVAVFSIGLATTLTLLGLAVVRGREALVGRLGVARGAGLVRAAAILAAGVVLLGGLLMTAIAIRAF